MSQNHLNTARFSKVAMWCYRETRFVLCLAKYPEMFGHRRADPEGQLYVDTGTDNEAAFGHPFEGYYLAYPGTSHAGLVSSITDEAPIMNWIYMDALTYEIKFGTRQYSEGHLTGPFDCTRQDRRMTLAGYEGFVAVKEGNFWALYFDWDGDRMLAKLGPGVPVVDVDLIRQEMRTPRPPRIEQPQQPGQQESQQQGQQESQQQAQPESQHSQQPTKT